MASLVALRENADKALLSFVASSGLDPEEVWAAMLSAKDIPEVLTEYLEGEKVWGQFKILRNAEIKALKSFLP